MFLQDLKKKILQECEAVTSESCIFATNTSSLSITDLASAGKRPQVALQLYCPQGLLCAECLTPGHGPRLLQQNVVGLHFFNPVSRMPLVEVWRLQIPVSVPECR